MKSAIMIVIFLYKLLLILLQKELLKNITLYSLQNNHEYTHSAGHFYEKNMHFHEHIIKKTQ